MAAWGAASFENDPASDWFLLVEEAVEERWLRELDDLIARLKHSGGGEPATLSP